jgi:microcystin-dependent protein
MASDTVPTAQAADLRESVIVSNPFIGTIRLVGFNFAPVGWSLCQGQSLAIAENAALFALLGTYFGGDGQHTFNLPDLRGRVAIGQGQGPGLSSYVQGQASGYESVALNTQQTPAHTHTMLASANVTAPNPGPGLALGTPASAVKMYGTDTPTALASVSIGPFGSSAAHENRQPFLALNYIIALTGIFPSQN